MNISTNTLAACCGARHSAAAPVIVTGVGTDTRTLRAGELFIALRGERHDGNDHLAAALAAGAAALLVDRATDHDIPVPVLHVEDTRQALAQLAAAWRQRFALPGIAVCGSNGKTTVKDMLAGILAREYGGDAIVATRDNRNNAIGVATTLLALAQQHRAFVSELGTNHPGEIIALAEMVRPTVALINNAQREHQEFFHDLDTVARENGGVIAMLSPQGTAVIPGDSAYAPLWRAIAGPRRCLSFGTGPDVDVRLSGVSSNNRGTVLELTGIPGLSTLVLQVPGQHNALNAVAAASCAHALGIGAEAIRAGLEAFSGTPGRLTCLPLPGDRLLVDDTYNANPDSVRAAIDVLTARTGPRWLVLGDMGECGEQSARFHAEAGRYARERGVDRLFTLGDDSHHAAAAFGGSAHHASTLPELLQALALLPEGSSLLVKGSHFMRMERVVAQVRQQFAGYPGEETASCAS
jgi:UDP-N-acetylmuramoyl-tripeptide--D-alanyl-D-alanine ligase